MTPLNYGAAGLRAARLYGQEDSEPQRASDRLTQRMQQRRSEIMGRGRTGLQSSSQLETGKPQELAPPPQLPPPSEGDGLLKSSAKAVASGGLSLVGGVGNFFDIPASMVRDLSTWVPGGIAAANPLDQLLPWNWASSDHRTTEEQLLESSGLYDDGPSEDRSTLTSIGRFIGEVGLGIGMDPLTYLIGPVNAVLKGGVRTAAAAGKAARAAGYLDDSFAAANLALRKAGTEAAGGEKKLGRVLGKREALHYASLEGIEKTSKLGDDLAKASREAKASNLNANLADQMGEAAEDAAEFKRLKSTPLAEDGMFHVGIPFTNVGKRFYKGEKAKKLARTMDKVGDFARFENPIGLKASAIFSKPMRGGKDSTAQRQALEDIDYLHESAMTARGMLYRPIKSIDDSRILDNRLMHNVKNADGSSVSVPVRTAEQINRISQAMTDYLEDIGRLKGSVVEGIPGRTFDPSTIAKYRRQLTAPLNEAELAIQADPARKLPAHREYHDSFQVIDEHGLFDALDEIKSATSKTLKDAQESGVSVEGLDDIYANYATRVLQPEIGKTRSQREQMRYDPNTEFATRRKGHLRNHPEGTSQIQRMSLNKKFAGIQHKSVARSSMKGDVDIEALKTEFTDVYDLEGQGFTSDQIDALWNDISKRDRRIVEKGLPIFEQNPASAALRNAEGLYQASAHAKGLKQFLKKVAKINQTAGMSRMMRESNDPLAPVTPSPDSTVYPDADDPDVGGGFDTTGPAPGSPGAASVAQDTDLGDMTKSQAATFTRGLWFLDDYVGEPTDELMEIARELHRGDDVDQALLAKLKGKDGWHDIADEIDAIEPAAVTEEVKVNKRKARVTRTEQNEKKYKRTVVAARAEAKELGLTSRGGHEDIEIRIAAFKKALKYGVLVNTPAAVSRSRNHTAQSEPQRHIWQNKRRGR